MTFRDMEEVRQANREAGDFWFSPDTLRFFNSVVESDLIDGRYFVTSEQGPDMPRKFSVREVREDATVQTVGEFYAYDTLEDALADIP